MREEFEIAGLGLGVGCVCVLVMAFPVALVAGFVYFCFWCLRHFGVL